MSESIVRIDENHVFIKGHEIYEVDQTINGVRSLVWCVFYDDCFLRDFSTLLDAMVFCMEAL